MQLTARRWNSNPWSAADLSQQVAERTWWGRVFRLIREFCGLVHMRAYVCLGCAARGPYFCNRYVEWLVALNFELLPRGDLWHLYLRECRHFVSRTPGWPVRLLAPPPGAQLADLPDFPMNCTCIVVGDISSDDGPSEHRGFRRTRE